MNDILRTVLLRELATFERELALLPSEDAVWQVPPGVANAAGTLALHVAGNLRHYVGARLGDTGYVRDRDAEFARRGVPRAELVAGLRAAADDVGATLARLPPEALDALYPEAVGGVRTTTGAFLVHLTAHLAYHLGQLDTLRRTLTGEARPAGALPLATLAAPAASDG